MADRIGRVERKTRETEITATVRLDGRGEVTAESGIGFLDHMLQALGRHGLMDLIVRAQGDGKVDDHHTVEDIGLALGQALEQALGDKRSIRRFASAGVPLDESLCRADVDISGRGGLYLRGAFPREKTGTFDTFLIEDFLRAFAVNAGLTLHLEIVAAGGPHHVAESAIKALAVALRDAVTVDNRIFGVPSTKGVL